MLVHYILDSALTHNAVNFIAAYERSLPPSVHILKNLFFSPPRILHTLLVFPTLEGHGNVGASPEEGHEVYKRARAYPLWREAEKIGAVQPREKKVAWRLLSNLPVSSKY